MSTALILVDIQNDYFPNGRMELSNPEIASENAGKILEQFRKEGNKIFHIQHIAADEGLGFFLPNTDGVNIHGSVAPLENEEVITKHAPNSFFQTELESKLRELDITKLVICGMMSHMCIDATVRSAVELGFECTVVEDACATLELTYQEKSVPAQQVHYAFMAALNSMYAKVVSTEEILKQK